MHALSRDTEFHKKACIYCQLDEPDELASASNEDIVCSHEIMLVPEDESEGVLRQHRACCMQLHCEAAAKMPGYSKGSACLPVK